MLELERVIRFSSLLLNYKNVMNVDCFRVNETIRSCVPVSHFDR